MYVMVFVIVLITVIEIEICDDDIIDFLYIGITERK
jgi:hypothetical protein